MPSYRYTVLALLTVLLIGSIFSIALAQDATAIDTTSTPPASSSANGQIVFASTRDGLLGLYLMDADGSNPRKINYDVGGDDHAAWSPDGNQIVFASNRGETEMNYDIYVMNADGSNLRRLTDDPSIDDTPKWSPDGTQIAFVSFRDADPEIYVLNVDGNNPVNISNTAGNDFHPNWSPDGLQITFSSDRDTINGQTDIYIMKADGSDVSNLTNDPSYDYRSAWQPVPKL